jgi:hypothetical protein
MYCLLFVWGLLCGAVRFFFLPTHALRIVFFTWTFIMDLLLVKLHTYYDSIVSLKQLLVVSLVSASMIGLSGYYIMVLSHSWQNCLLHLLSHPLSLLV